MDNPFANINVNGPPVGGSPSFNGGGASILNQVTSGRPKQGARMVIGALEKTGKTSLAADAPRAMMVQLEAGSSVVNIPKTPLLTSYGQIMQFCDECISACQRGQFQAKTLVFDTGTALETRIHEATIAADKKGRQTMETAHEGYGKAYAYANGLFEDFLRKCDELAIHGGINIILTSHVFVAKVIDPTYGEFDQYDILMHSPKNNKTYGKREMITQWADLIGYLHEPIFVSKGEGETLQRAQSKNMGRVLGVSRTPGYVAGNRYGVTGEIPIPDPTRSPYGTAWNNLAHAIYNASQIDLFNRDV